MLKAHRRLRRGLLLSSQGMLHPGTMVWAGEASQGVADGDSEADTAVAVSVENGTVRRADRKRSIPGFIQYG